MHFSFLLTLSSWLLAFESQAAEHKFGNTLMFIWLYSLSHGLLMYLSVFFPNHFFHFFSFCFNLENFYYNIIPSTVFIWWLSQFSSVTHIQLFATPWMVACQDSLSITNSRSLLKLISIESVMPSNNLILCRHLVLTPSIFPSIRAFSNKSALRIRWPQYWRFSFSISPSNEYSGLISFRMDWLDLPAFQGTLKSILQHHSSKHQFFGSAFFIVQLSHPCMTTGKTVALTRQTFVGKVMSLLLNTLSRLVITFLPRSKRLLISWLQSPSAVILEPPKIKSDTVSIASQSICMKWWDQMSWSYFSECWVLSQLFTLLFHFHQEAL